jgi:hypothetical protein
LLNLKGRITDTALVQIAFLRFLAPTFISQPEAQFSLFAPEPNKGHHKFNFGAKFQNSNGIVVLPRDSASGRLGDPLHTYSIDSPQCLIFTA